MIGFLAGFVIGGLVVHAIEWLLVLHSFRKDKHGFGD